VAGDEHGQVLVGQPADQAAQPVDALRVEAVGRLVQDQDVGVAQQGGGQAEALAHPEREAPDPPAGGRGQPRLLQDLVDPRRGQPGRGGQDPQVVASRAARMEPALLQHGPDPPGRPSMVAAPEVGATRPSSIRRVVVLPAPLGPRKPVTVPGSTSKSRRSTANTSPNRL